MEGWDALPALTGGIRPEEVDALKGVRDLESVYPLLHTLVGRSLRDFFVRAAALESLVGSGRASFGAQDFAEILFWLDEPARDSVLVALRRSGWLVFEAGHGTTITSAGRWAHDVLSFLHRQLNTSELLPTIAGVDYALQIGHDPIRLLLSMRSRLIELRDEIESARASFSEVVLRRAQARLGDAMVLSNDIRKILDKVPLDQRAAREVVRDIHDLLSQLHGKTSELHAAITEIGRQYLHLSAGVTTEQIVAALMRLTVGELGRTGQEALLPVITPPPLLTTEVVAHAAEVHVQKERHADEPTRWEDPPMAESAPADVGTPEEVVQLLADLAGVVLSGRVEPFSSLVPRQDSSTSFLRASLLALAGTGISGEGVAGKLGALPVEVAVNADGWPEPLFEGPLTELTGGSVRAMAPNSPVGPAAVRRSNG